MKLLIVTTTVLLSMLAGSLIVTIVSWANTEPFSARSQIVGSPTCSSMLTPIGANTDDRWVTSAAVADQDFELSSEGADLYSSPSWGCTINTASSDFGTLAALQAER